MNIQQIKYNYHVKNCVLQYTVLHKFVNTLSGKLVQGGSQAIVPLVDISNELTSSSVFKIVMLGTEH